MIGHIVIGAFIMLILFWLAIVIRLYAYPEYMKEEKAKKICVAFVTIGVLIFVCSSLAGIIMNEQAHKEYRVLCDKQEYIEELCDEFEENLDAIYLNEIMREMEVAITWSSEVRYKNERYKKFSKYWLIRNENPASDRINLK